MSACERVPTMVWRSQLFLMVTPRKRNAVVEETFELASRVMDYAEVLSRANSVFADQILRSGTSVGSHTREAQSAESLADFTHKMKIAHKELEETEWDSSSLIWVCSSAHGASQVAVMDANNPGDVLEAFTVCSSHLLCVTSVPGRL